MTDPLLVPDPLAFSLAALAGRGALIDEPERLAVLPPDVARDLALPEEARLTRDGDGAGVPCGLGTPLLSRLVQDARAQVPVCHVRLQRDPPRASHAAALGERLVVRNGLCELCDAFPGESTYVAASVAYVADADDRHEGVVQVVVHAADGGEPDAGLCRLLDAARTPDPAALKEAAPVSGAEEAVPFITARADRLVRATLAGVQEALVRRHARDHGRTSEYFAALIAEALKPRRRVDPQAVLAKVAHIVAERDAKLSDLQARFTLRVSLHMAALLCAQVPVVRVRLRARRRKEERELVTRLPAGAHVLDRLACDGCPGTTSRPLLCDDRLHVLCEACAPGATGRPRCPACRRARG